MKTAWWIGIFFVFVVAQMTAATLEASATGASGSVWGGLFDVSGMEFSNPLSAVWSVVVMTWEFLSNVLTLLLWNYPSIFHGSYAWFRMAFLYPLSAAVIIGVIMAIRGTSSS